MTDTITGGSIPNFTAILNGSRVSIAAAGYITRETSASAATVDLIPEAGFDLEFYRQFARNSQAGAPEPLRVLTRAPMFYIETEGSTGFSHQTAAILEEHARTLVPLLTGRRFQLSRWETGPEPRAPEPGWIMIERYNASDVCGRALIGASAGRIWLNVDAPLCVRRILTIFAHELGHAFGFWHVDHVGAMMFPDWGHPSSRDVPTEAELRSAAVAYARPRGNRDLDIDP